MMDARFDVQVQHLIEKCICYKLNKEECMETLEKHAKVMPVITSTGRRHSILQATINRDYCKST